MKIRSVAILTMLLGLIFVFPILPAHAVSPAFVQSKSSSGCGLSTTCHATFTGSVTAGNLIVVGFVWSFSGSAQTVTVADNVGNIYARASEAQWTGTNCNTNTQCNVDVWYSFSTTGGAVTVTATSTGTINGANTMEIYEFSGTTGMTLAGGGTGTCITACTTSLSTSSVSYSSQAILFSQAWAYGSTFVGGSCGFGTIVNGEVVNVASCYSVAPAASPSIFPMTAGGVSTAWGEASAAFHVQAGVTVTVVKACTFFQMQCWLYPLFFLAMYGSFFVGVGAAFRLSQKGFMYMVLAGASFGSLIEIQLGIMTPLVPLMLLVGNIVYSLRIDKLIGRVGQRGEKT